MTSPAPKDDHTDKQALRESIHSAIAACNREFDETHYYTADKMLDTIISKVDAYTEQRELLAIKATTDKMVTDFNNAVADHRGDKDIDRHEFVVGLLWGVAAAISIPVDKRLAQLKASTTQRSEIAE